MALICQEEGHSRVFKMMKFFFRKLCLILKGMMVALLTVQIV